MELTPPSSYATGGNMNHSGIRGSGSLSKRSGTYVALGEIAEPKVLMIDDQVGTCTATARCLRSLGWHVGVANTVSQGLLRLSQRRFQAVLLDLRFPDLPDDSYLEVVDKVLNHSTRPAVVVYSGIERPEVFEACLQQGVYFVLQKPTDPDEIDLRLRQAIGLALVPGIPAEDQFISCSSKMRQILHLVDRYADSEAPVLITGETGTGKELIARRLHRGSPRRDKKLVAINCATLPDGLLDSLLFGHRRGAFTGADRDAMGFFEEANGGTLFLDELGVMPLVSQPRLLRVLETGEVYRVGDTRSRKVDVRVIAATNRDLRVEMEKGTFCSDVFYRLSVAELHVPPLRERKEDIRFLVGYFMKKLQGKHPRVEGIEETVLRSLEAYDWKGNVGELLGVLEAMMMASRGRIDLNAVPQRIRRFTGAREPGGPDTLWSAEQVLEEAGGNKRLAAQMLGIGRTTLYRRLGRAG